MANDDIAPPYNQEQPQAMRTDEKKYGVEHIDKTAEYHQFKEEAMDAENREQAMTVMEAVKAYPMACTWAFIMSSTIVSDRVATSFIATLAHESILTC
jgi:SP family general alpha glucoside:H+ symporter-like MFS transporter